MTSRLGGVLGAIAVLGAASCSSAGDQVTVKGIPSSTAAATVTTRFEPEFVPTSDFDALVAQAQVVGEFEVLRIERGERYRDGFDDRATLAIAVVHPVDVYTPGGPTGDLRLTVGSWLVNPSDHDSVEVLHSAGWTFAAGDRFVAGIEPTRFDGIFGFSNPDSYFVVVGDRLAPELAENRARIGTIAGIVEAAETMTADELRQAVRAAVDGARHSLEPEG